MNQKQIVRSLSLGAASLLALSVAACDNGAGGGNGGSPGSSSAGSPTSSAGSPTGTAGSPTTSSGNPSSSAGSSGQPGGTFVNAGYVMTGPWGGYGYTVSDTLGEGTTVSPSCSGGTCTPPFAGDTFCMTGSVAPDAAYNGFALLGWNLAQSTTAGSTPGGWAVPASGGVTITVANPDSAPMRLQVEIPNATTTADRYCATLTSGTEIQWSELETECYNATGNTKLAAGTMLQNAAVQVYGTNMAAVPYNICITGMTVQ